MCALHAGRCWHPWSKLFVLVGSHLRENGYARSEASKGVSAGIENKKEVERLKGLDISCEKELCVAKENSKRGGEQ